MIESNENDPNIADQCQEESSSDGSVNYFEAARAAYDSGDRVLAMHLYLSAYEEKCGKNPLPDEEAIAALRAAWRTASELRERSIAEYIFDKLEPHLGVEEAEEFARELQSMTLDKLSEFGISRADLEGVADTISEEIGATARIAGITPISSAVVPASAVQEGAAGESFAKVVGVGKIAEASAVQESGRPTSSEEAPSGPEALIAAVANAAKPNEKPRSATQMRFKDLVGFDGVIADMRAFGIGVAQDEEYRVLMDTLRAQHGLDGLSALGSIVFRTSSREDASMFMVAVAGELGLPVLRVQMQSGPQGMPVLCVTTAADRPVRMGTNRLSIESPGVLILEDFDLWGASLIESASAAEGEGIAFAAMQRAAREAFGLIASAVGNPDVYVLASMAGDAPDQGYLYDMMEPMNIVDIYLPDEIERRRIWDAVAHDHPSVRQLDLSRLTRLSKNMSRFDIVSAGREAVEDAYRRSMKEMRYIPVTQSMMFEHVANFQPLDSEEYRLLEDAVAADFQGGMDDLLDQVLEDADYERPTDEGSAI